jgi:hypothetical protein
MKRITIYHHKDCAKCRKIARVHKALDWLGRVEISTGTPKTGPLQMGEIAVEDARTGETALGVDAVRAIARQVPAYTPLRPLLCIPAIARRVDQDVRACTDGRCGVPLREEARQEATGHA